MGMQMIRPAGYWQHLERVVAAQVSAAMHGDGDARREVMMHLRSLEEIARGECDRRETIQIIASGRRLLGDRSEVGLHSGPFVPAFGPAP